MGREPLCGWGDRPFSFLRLGEGRKKRNDPWLLAFCSQSRVTSVHSWYLTSFVILSFVVCLSLCLNNPETLFLFSLMRIPLVFVCFCHRWKAKRELLFEACTDPRPEYKLLNITHKSILCVTPPWFFYRFGPFGNFRLPLFEVVKLNLPLECTFLSSPIV